jgi:hypothetical protein
VAAGFRCRGLRHRDCHGQAQRAKGHPAPSATWDVQRLWAQSGH